MFVNMRCRVYSLYTYRRVEHHLTKNPLQRLLHHNVAHPSRCIAVTVGRETASAEAPLFASLCSSRRGSAGLISSSPLIVGGEDLHVETHIKVVRGQVFFCFATSCGMLIEVNHANGHVVQDGHLNLVLFVLLADGAQLAQFHTLLGDQQHAPRGTLH